MTNFDSDIANLLTFLKRHVNSSTVAFIIVFSSVLVLLTNANVVGLNLFSSLFLHRGRSGKCILTTLHGCPCQWKCHH